MIAQAMFRIWVAMLTNYSKKATTTKTYPSAMLWRVCGPPPTMDRTLERKTNLRAASKSHGFETCLSLSRFIIHQKKTWFLPYEIHTKDTVADWYMERMKNMIND
jgi:hypothetical protein